MLALSRAQSGDRQAASFNTWNRWIDHRLFGEEHSLLIDGDPGRLAQVIGNFLTNAAKYTEPSGEIIVRARRLASDVELSVRASGVGIDPEMLPRVFDMFAQERQSLDRSRGGLGLGLAIVRGLVGLHGGSVTAASAGTGRGAEFTVRLPSAAHRPDDAVVEPPCAQTSASAIVEQRVLVVDDNCDAADLLCDVLRALGFEAIAVYDGPSALSELERFAPYIALIDIGLPVMDGYEVARRIASDSRFRATGLVAVTGYGLKRDHQASKEAGFAAHLVKPVDATELREVLARLAAEASADDVASR